MIKEIRKRKNMKHCPIAKKCGSCQYIDIPYQKQLLEKKDYCTSLIQKCKLKGIKIEDVAGMENPYSYRNKIIISFNQKYEYGFYEENSHKIIPYKHCLLHEEESDLIITKIQSLFKKYRVSIYDDSKRKGLVRHILIRRAMETNQTMIVLVCTESVFPGSKNFCNELVKSFSSIKTIVLNVNKRKTSIVLGNEEKLLYGKGFVVDKLCGLSFKISASSFYQINHKQCEQLYKKLLSLLSLKGSEVVVDAYCGIGTIGMLVAKNVKQVIGIEKNQEAVMDAINNAKHNEIRNISFICEDATDYMNQLVTKKKNVDIIILDPPRIGSTKEFMDAVKKLNVKQVVYVSCDPNSLIRDMQYFKTLGYQTDVLYPYDMFPHTKHTEIIILLQRGK